MLGETAFLQFRKRAYVNSGERVEIREREYFWIEDYIPSVPHAPAFSDRFAEEIQMLFAQLTALMNI